MKVLEQQVANGTDPPLIGQDDGNRSRTMVASTVLVAEFSEAGTHSDTNKISSADEAAELRRLYDFIDHNQDGDVI